jgi:hypothetical protein
MMRADAETFYESVLLQQNTVNDGLRVRGSQLVGRQAATGRVGNSTYGAFGTGGRALPVTAFHLA